jgi:hypothetical protein
MMTRQEEIADIAMQIILLFAEGGDAWIDAEDLMEHLSGAEREAVMRQVQRLTEAGKRGGASDQPR